MESRGTKWRHGMYHARGTLDTNCRWDVCARDHSPRGYPMERVLGCVDDYKFAINVTNNIHITPIDIPVAQHTACKSPMSRTDHSKQAREQEGLEKPGPQRVHFLLMAHRRPVPSGIHLFNEIDVAAPLSSVSLKPLPSITSPRDLITCISHILTATNETRITMDELDDMVLRETEQRQSFLPYLVDKIKHWLRQHSTEWRFVSVPQRTKRDNHWGIHNALHRCDIERSYIEHKHYWFFKNLNDIGCKLLPSWQTVFRHKPVSSANIQCKPLYEYIVAKARYYAGLRDQLAEYKLVQLSSNLSHRRQICAELGFQCFKYCYGHQRDILLFGDEECPICIDTICHENDMDVAEYTIWVLPCGHITHSECYHPIINGVLKCPFRCPIEAYDTNMLIVD